MTPKTRETGPGPLRTARGAGRREDALERLRDFAGLDRELGRLLVLRDRVLEPLVVRLDPDVLELRDPGGEDVRVAMLATLRESHTSPMDHLRACRDEPSRPGRRTGRLKRKVLPTPRVELTVMLPP